MSNEAKMLIKVFVDLKPVFKKEANTHVYSELAANLLSGITITVCRSALHSLRCIYKQSQGFVNKLSHCHCFDPARCE